MPAAPDADAAALVRTVAANVRTLRTAAGLTLPELAERTRLGRSTLAQLESGRANPSVETLWAIAAALDVPFGRLVEAAVPPVRVVRAGEGVRLELEESALRTRLLATSPRRGSFEVYVVEADPGQPRHADPHSPGTVEHLVVTAGTLRAGPADRPERLATGDLLTFAADVPHLYEALAPGTAALLLMDYP
jgi:transcriptional regulator with XRE-family HTH domain